MVFKMKRDMERKNSELRKKKRGGGVRERESAIEKK